MAAKQHAAAVLGVDHDVLGQAGVLVAVDVEGDGQQVGLGPGGAETVGLELLPPLEVALGVEAVEEVDLDHELTDGQLLALELRGERLHGLKLGELDVHLQDVTIFERVSRLFQEHVIGKRVESLHVLMTIHLHQILDAVELGRLGLVGLARDTSLHES